MGNLLQYTDKSKSINLKLEQLLSEIYHDYQNGLIRTETEYYYKIKEALTNFYESLSKPSFKYRPAISTPISDDYNNMIQESYNDMEYIIKDCETLNNFVSQSFDDAEINRRMMQNKLSFISKKIKTVAESVSANQPIGSVIFSEMFSNISNMGNKDDVKSCMISSELGILSLQSNMYNNVIFDNIEIDKDVSNGLPGNTHVADSLNGELHFIGQEGIHNDPKSMVDGNQDTWFEFELFNITDETRKQCNSFGFEYDEGIQWITDDNILKLKIICTINNPCIVSWINLIPYLSDVKGIKNSYIEKIEVITTENNVYCVTENKSFDDSLVFPFPPYAVQRIEITLYQSSKYLTKIGHHYYTMTDTESMSIFQDYDYSDSFSRVDGKKHNIGLIGCKHDPINKWVIYPNSNDSLPDENYCKSKLFTIPESTIDKKGNEELVDAYRYMIGIREISASSYTFVEEGEYVSCIYETDEPITSITLEAKEWIPGEDSEILRYFISLNGGLTWHKIYPIHRAYDGIYKYYVNNDSIENHLRINHRYQKSKNISFVGIPTKIQLKIEMDRPSAINQNYEYTSPIVYSYKLKLTVGGDTIEY